MSDSLQHIQERLRALAHPEKAKILSGFFKTGPGEYGEGDRFLGITVPQIRDLVKRYADIPLEYLAVFVTSEFHEERLFALLVAVHQYEKGSIRVRNATYRWYIKHLATINNWDLIDLSADKIIGRHLMETRASGGVLEQFAKSKNLWRRRVAIMATFAFIKKGRHVPTFNIARMLLKDSEDLIHKAVGWMLREVGKRIGQDVEEDFLRAHYQAMPRTMLRYAIERFPRRLYRAYLTGRVEPLT